LRLGCGCKTSRLNNAPPKRVAQKFHCAILQIEVTRASRGLSAIAELFVFLLLLVIGKINSIFQLCDVLSGFVQEWHPLADVVA